MRITDIEVEVFAANRAVVSWSGDSTKNVWIVVNGEVFLEDASFSADEKSWVITIPNTSKPFVVEVHEAEAGATIVPLYAAADLTPILFFDAVGTADYYRIYHSIERDGEESLLRTVQGDPAASRHSLQLQRELDGEGGKWHFFRVEAVSETGEVSTTPSWAFWAYDVPPCPEGVEITGSAGTFDIVLS